MQIWTRVLVLSSLCLVAPHARADDGITAKIAACDKVAAEDGDRDNPPGVEGVGTDSLDANAAIPACQAAVDAVVKPDAGVSSKDARRMEFALGRALYKAGKYPEAKMWLEKAVAKGSIVAMATMSLYYLEGKAVPQDLNGAREWVEKAAQAGDPGAMSVLGMAYSSGSYGAQVDYAKARSWYEKGAAAGDPDSMAGLGDLYEAGGGVQQDFAKAKAYYEKSAAAGSAQGMTGMGMLYESGEGVKQSNAEARGWYEKAAAAGSEEARKRLGVLPK